MKKKVFIYAYTQQNLGDDLFIKMLCDRYPDVKFYIMCNKSVSKSFKEIPNLSVIKRVPFIDGILNKMNINLNINSMVQRAISLNCDAIVNIGGSIFIESVKWENKFLQFKKRLIKHTPYFIIGSNFGPYNSNKYLEKYKEVFKNIEDICFREEYSYNLFSELPNVRLAPDVVFSFIPKCTVETQKSVIISVIDLSKRKELAPYENIYHEQILNLSRKFAEKNYTVYLMGFCVKEKDQNAIDKILNRLTEKESEQIKPYIYTGDLNNALELIQKSKYVLGSRFHAMILGWVFNKPVYPIIYSDKSLHVMNDIGFKGEYIKIQDLDSIKVNNVVNSLIDSEPLDITQQIEFANLQFKGLDQFLADR